MSVRIQPLKAEDRAAWEVLARGYKHFYNTPTSDAEFDAAWRRLLDRDGVHGLAAWLDGQLVGIAHYLFHASVWFDDVCYLADLFVDEAVRGQGAARLLIEEVAAAARARGCPRYYWLTQVNNVRARGLYDKVARHVGFIRYDYPMT